ncbi:hypothetical protein PC121_g19206 [Phytophthora cactorum]|nr:hypothetical protein PC121_g19206 [Phytophthora cactorum]KAG4043783.1 hypothetical protein PC123_g20753 [Phytophthora cactorum]
MAQRSPVADADPSERVRRPRLPWTLPWSTPAFIAVQSDPRCPTYYTSTAHIIQYFPVVYYCASQRRADDITWILAYLKKHTLRMLWEGMPRDGSC